MDVVVVEFDGGIEDFPALIQTLDLLIADGEQRLVLDLGGLPFINSAALGYLLKARSTLERQGGRLALCGVQPAIGRILEMTNLDTLLPSFPTEEAAVDALGGDAAHEGAGPHPVRRVPWR